MANSLQCFLHPTRRAYGSTIVSSSRSFSADSLVEIKPGEIGMVSGIPQEHLRRRVVIFSPAQSATQQGSGKVRDVNGAASPPLWENPLMGWTSTGDPYANVGDAGLGFDSEEAAVAFAQKHGWDYMVKKQHTPLLKVKAYADNCKWKALPKLRKFDFSPKSSFSWLILAKAFVTLWRLAFPLWLSTKQVVLEKYELPRLQ